MRLLLCITILILTTGCQTESSALRKQIRDLKEEPSDSSQQALIAVYNQYISTFPSDSQRVSSYLRELAAIEYKSFRYAAAISYLYTGLRDYYSIQDETIENIRFLKHMYTQTVQSDFLSTILDGVAYQAFPNAFEPPMSQESVEALLERKQKLVYTELAQFVDMESANVFISACELYALILPHKTQSPNFLFAAAEVCQGLGVFQRSLGLLDWITSRYPNHKRGIQASFLKGFILDEYLNDTVAAKNAYQTFLTTYPNNEFTDDVKLLLEAL